MLRRHYEAFTLKYGSFALKEGLFKYSQFETFSFRHKLNKVSKRYTTHTVAGTNFSSESRLLEKERTFQSTVITFSQWNDPLSNHFLLTLSASPGSLCHFHNLVLHLK